MTRAIETEIKLVASPAMLEKLRSHPALAGADRTDLLVTTYFDTVGARLRRSGAALRVRESGKGREQTLKLTSRSGPSVRRGELNAPVAGDLPDPAGFPVKARKALVRLLDGAPLVPVGTSRIERTTRRLHFGNSAIEIAFDRGTIVAGDREQAIHELELELVEGHLCDVMALALQLPLGAELTWSVASKAEQCQLLAYDLRPVATHSRPARLAQTMDAATGFQEIAWNCLGQLLANYPLVIASGDSEAVHQCRVAIRRLRAACSLFGTVADDGEAPVLRDELKAVATGLGPAREMQVLLDRVTPVSRVSGMAVGELLAHLGTRKDAATQSAQVLLASGSFQRLLFQFAGWVEGGKWLGLKAETGGDRPLMPFATRALSKRRRKLRLGDPLSDLSDAERHRLRLDAKKLRYGAEFFASLYPGKETASRQRAFVKDLARLQGSLGALNDMLFAATAHKTLFEDLDPISAAGLAAQLEELLIDGENSRSKLLRIAQRSLSRIAGARAWWKNNRQ